MNPFLYVSIAFILIWIGVLIFSKNTRREQLIMSLVGFLISPAILLVTAQDYRAAYEETVRGLSIETILFITVIFGLSAVIYQALLCKQTEKLRKKKIKITHPLQWVAHIIIILGIWGFITSLLMLAFSLVSIQAFIISGLLIGTYIIADRKDLLFNALLSGLIIAILIFLIEQIFFVYLYPETASALWQIDNLSGFFLGVVPIEVIAWAAVAGFSIGPLYEYVRDFKLK